MVTDRRLIFGALCASPLALRRTCLRPLLSHQVSGDTTVTKLYLRATSSLDTPPGRTVTSRKPQFVASSVMKAPW